VTPVTVPNVLRLFAIDRRAPLLRRGLQLETAPQMLVHAVLAVFLTNAGLMRPDRSVLFSPFVRKTQRCS
jgi:hypothetical protein